jgi:hypothetical protein
VIQIGLHRFATFLVTHYGGPVCIRSFLGKAVFLNMKVNLDWRSFLNYDTHPTSMMDERGTAEEPIGSTWPAPKPDRWQHGEWNYYDKTEWHGWWRHGQ